MRKDQSLSLTMQDIRKDHTVKLLNKLKHPFQLNPASVFLKLEKFLQGSDGEFPEQSLASSVITRCTNNDEKQILNPHHSVWGGH